MSRYAVTDESTLSVKGTEEDLRQRVLADHERRLALGDDLDLPAYCYQDLDVTYPVLAAVAAVGDRLDTLRRQIEREMGRAR